MIFRRFSGFATKRWALCATFLPWGLRANWEILPKRDAIVFLHSVGPAA
jgi:hypothetical protein